MDALPIARWRTKAIHESITSLVLKRGDTNPDPGIWVFTLGVPYSLVGTTATARLRFRMTLKQKVPTNVTVIRTSIDSRLRVGDTIIIDSERMSVVKIDQSSDPGFYRLKVTRSETPQVHESGSNITIPIFDRSAQLVDENDKNKYYVRLQPGDTDRLGDFALEFEIRETGNPDLRYSLPATPIPITVVEDFNNP